MMHDDMIPNQDREWLAGLLTIHLKNIWPHVTVPSRALMTESLTQMIEPLHGHLVNLSR